MSLRTLIDFVGGVFCELAYLGIEKSCVVCLCSDSMNMKE